MSLLGVADKPTGIRRRFCKNRNEYWADELPTEEKRGLPARSQPSKKQPGLHSSELVGPLRVRLAPRRCPLHDRFDPPERTSPDHLLVVAEVPKNEPACAGARCARAQSR